MPWIKFLRYSNFAIIAKDFYFHFMIRFSPQNDKELTNRLIKGDIQAFETIYRKYASGLYRYARKNIPSKEECEEIIQDVFESLWRRHGELQCVEVLDAYLYRTVRYKVICYFRHQSVKQKYADYFRQFEATYDAPNGIEEVQSLSPQSLLDNVKAYLPSRCQQAVRLRLIENLSNADIASRMNISKGTVENYMVRAFQCLREAYRNPDKVS